MGESRSVVQNIVAELTEAERLANHIPEGVWKMARVHNVFIKDEITGELIQVLDLCEEESEDPVVMNVRTRPKRRKK